MGSKRKLFELFALKDKLERNKHFIKAKTISEEIKRNNSLKEKLQEIANEEKEITKSMTALQLKSKKWYNLKIQEQILAAETKNTFLEKENRNIQKKIALKHHKMKNSIEKASYHKKIEKEVSENKQLLSYPALNKGFEN